MIKKLRFVLCGVSVFLWLVSPPLAKAATPTVVSVAPGKQSVGQYQKFEADIQISKVFPAGSLIPYYYYDNKDNPTNFPGRNSPYGIDGISIDIHLTSPTGKQLVLPAFYYQDFTRSGSVTAGETMTPSVNTDWKVRFAPEEVGNYTYYVTIADKEGNTRYPVTGNLTLTATTSSSKGFIKVSKRDSRFLEFSTGPSFVPIASGRQWWQCCGKRSFDYEQAFSDFSKNGINLTRIWDQNDGYALTVEGRFDAYAYPDDYNPEGKIDVTTLPKGTQVNQRGAYEEDKIIESAEKNGVYIQLTSHEDPYWIWDASVHNESWNPNPTTFSDPLHINYWKRNFRYRVARWGYSTAILAWETWNEHGHVLPGSDIYNFYQTYGQYQLDTDPFKHLRTTSQGSQAFSPAFWSSNAFDLANYHNYIMGWLADDLKNDEANFVYKTAWCLQPPSENTTCSYLGLGDGTSWSGSAKPWIWGEFDVGTSNWNEVNPNTQIGEGRLRELHNSMWAGLFSPMGTSPIDWYWSTEDSSTTNTKYMQKKAANAFFADVDYAGANFNYLMTPNDRPNGYNGETILTSDNNARAYVMRRGDKNGVYLWVQNKKHTWNNATVTIPDVSTILTISGLNNNIYAIQIWNTYTGTITSLNNQTTNNGTLNISINNLADDVAIKVVPSSGGSNGVNPTSIPTNAPTGVVPTSVISPSPSPVSGSGDVNQDGKVNMSDISALFNNWSTNSTATDQFSDGQINSLDFVFVKNKILAVQSTPTTNPTPTATGTPIPIATPSPVPNQGGSASEWTQFGHDAQRTNYTASAIATPWKYKWQWNGAGADGKKQAGHVNVPNLVQPITGGNRVYMVAGNTVYALDKNTGAELWTKGNIGALSATPVYDQEYLYITSGNSIVYKLNASNGSTVATFTADSALNLTPVLANGVIFTDSVNGTLYALDKNTLTKNWSYYAGSPAVTPPAVSLIKQTVVFVSQDLFVHAVKTNDGTRRWRIKPTNRNYTISDPANNLTQADAGWPVIAEQHGIVFIRYRLEWQTLWDGPYPTTNAAIRTFLTTNPQKQALFALNLDNGSTAFIPAVGNGGQGDGGVLPMGPQPVVRNINGQEIAYMIWRNQLTCIATSWCDGREDATMGEMVLDASTVPGYQAGDMRFVQFIDIQSDEMMNLTMSGSTLFHNHWLAAEGQTITDRSNNLGNTFANPIKTQSAPYIIWRQVYCPPTNTNCNPAIYPGGSGSVYGPANCLFDSVHRYCNSGLYSYGDSRAFPPGFYEYFNDNNEGSTPFTIVSGNLVLVKTMDGGLMALESGNPLAGSNNINVALATSTGETKVLGTTNQITPAVGLADTLKYVNQNVTVSGKIVSGQNHLPKAVYLTLSDGEKGNLLIRIFSENISKFPYDPLTLIGKQVQITGTVTLYWPDGIKPEIILSDPSQISKL